jgi:hypothetical protein
MIKFLSSERLEALVDGAPIVGDTASLEAHAEDLSTDGVMARLALARQALTDVDFDRCRTQLALAQQTLDSLHQEDHSADAMARALVAVRLDTIRAWMAWLRGTQGDATVYIDQASERLHGLTAAGLFHDEQTAMDRARLPIARLQANLESARGDYRHAETTLVDALDLAMRLHSHLVAAFHQAMGALLLHQGRPVVAGHHLRLALDRMVPGSQPLDEVNLYLLLTDAALMRSNPLAAHEFAGHARALREHHVLPAWIRARIAMHQARTEDKIAGQSGPYWKEAITESEESGAAALMAEVRLRAALSAVAHRALPKATHLVKEAKVVMESAGEPGGMVRALLEMADAMLAHHGNREREARAHWMRARTWYAEEDAFYDMARVDAHLARIGFREGDIPAFQARWELACRAANRGGFQLPIDLDSRVLHQLSVGLPEAARYGRRQRSDRSYTGADVQVTRRSGTLTVFGDHYVLGPQSQLIRLICALIRSGHGGLPPSILCRRLWRNERFTSQTFNRLKVHIHRLREVIGGQHDAILTDRSPAGKRQIFYRWNPALTAQIA